LAIRQQKKILEHHIFKLSLDLKAYSTHSAS